MITSCKYALEETPNDYWDFVYQYGTIFQSRDYLHFLATFDRKSFVIAIRDGPEIIGGSAVRPGPSILKLPSIAEIYFGPVVADRERFGDVFKCLTNTLKPVCFICYVEVCPEHAGIISSNCDLKGWTIQNIEYLHWDISGPLENIWSTLPDMKKKNVKRGRREQIIIEEIQTLEQVKQFYDLHAMSMAQSGLEPRPHIYYQNLITFLKPKGLATGLLALHPETRKPIASVILLLGLQGEATYLAMGHNYEFRHLRGPDFLIWHCVEFLKTRGFTKFDLSGLPLDSSKRAEGIRRFKTKWANQRGHHCSSFILSHGMFGLSPMPLRGFLLSLKKFTKVIYR
jgi:hypothetical protein